MANIASGETGARLTDLLAEVWMQPASLKSTLSRQRAREFAIAAQHGLITTFDHRGQMRHAWFITQRGLQFINRREA